MPTMERSSATIEGQMLAVNALLLLTEIEYRPSSRFSGKTKKDTITHKIQPESRGERMLPRKIYVCPMLGCSKNFSTYAKKMNHFRRRHLPSATEDRPKAQFYNPPSLESHQAATKGCQNGHSWNGVRVMSYPRLLSVALPSNPIDNYSWSTEGQWSAYIGAS
ncbi:uncharacterized protein BO96DRAFT_259543 [Aspergillus niger CBS 101883]|uniref:uncharacterized protein n=1 Tax=Aspergillus lacticoffeatus (strain CBS 101883) TaxID=1450533 RepID=UPI000D7FCAFB|nr:uncharacterized protein BO96DRAFT_259543 [Aspergillus niger CBS 101883]PYH50128.1 hypothetical protein BO96DRAFT_259543 [Aspergillus niger CBS 101883]